jgi:poly-gamma-glutamate synthesis protein (capsule biosynthesis protein)
VIPAQGSFAHWLVDHGVGVGYGHSSRHPRRIEVYRGTLILYGSGDLIEDYEGIGGYEVLRKGLRLLYFVSLAPATGRLRRLTMTLLQYPPDAPLTLTDARWLHGEVQDASRPLATRVDVDGSLTLGTAAR